MKKKIIFAILIIIIILVVVGALVWQRQRREFEGPVVIEENVIPDENVLIAKKGEAFVMPFAANPTTGYQWKAEFDSDYLELVKQEFFPFNSSQIIPGDDVTVGSKIVVGEGGIENFEFLALEEGETELVFSYFRSWEEGVEPIEKHIYRVRIKQ